MRVAAKVHGRYCTLILTRFAFYDLDVRGRRYNGMLVEVVTTFCTAKLTNAAGTTAFQTFLFCVIWRLQKDTTNFHVSSVDYEQ